MPRRHLRFTATDVMVESGLDAIRDEMEIPSEFPSDVLEEARDIEPTVPDVDMRQVPLVTIDPPGSRDLDQAVHIAPRDHGYRVTYAIADVAAFVAAGGPMDREARRRGLTLYAPDRRTPLYPPILSEGHASLLPDQDRPAVVWTLDLDSDGRLEDVDVRRAMIRSREQLDYQSVQQDLDSGAAPESLQLLAEVGRLRRLIEEERGGVSLPIPEQRVVRTGSSWALRYQMPLPIEGWNAQISLLTGIAAAELMVRAGTGILRTLPPARDRSLAWIRRVARALRVSWPEHVAYPALIRSLDARLPSHAALLAEATTLFSGANYQVLAPGAQPLQHSALATVYAHATAPLRRLVDRYVSETCLSIASGTDVPHWVDEGIDDLPKIMARAGSLSGRFEAACLDLVEAAVLSDKVGRGFDGVVVEVDGDDPHGDVQIREPAVHARLEGEDLDLGAEIRVQLVEASVPDRRVVFARSSDQDDAPSGTPTMPPA